MPLKFDETICPKNHRCPLIDVCPVNAISQESITSLPQYDSDKCIKCEACVHKCGMKAVSVVK